MVRERDGLEKPSHKVESRLWMEYRAHLAWIEGYPVAAEGGIQWQTIPRRGAPAAFELTAQRMSNATRAYHEMAREARDSRLKQVLEDVVPGWQRLPQALSLIGEVRRAGVPLAPWSLLSPRAAKVAQGLGTSGFLHDIARAIAWSTVATLAEEETIAWLADNARPLMVLSTRLDRTTAVRFACILGRLASAKAVRHLGGLLELLGNDVLFTTPTAAGSDGAPPATGSRLGREVIDAAEALLSESSTTQNYALRLLELVVPVAWAAQWEQHWQAWAECQHRKERALAAWSRGDARRDEARNVVVPKAPPALNPKTLITCILAEARSGDDQTDLAIALVGTLPPEAEAPGVRARAFVQFSQRLRYPPNGKRDAGFLRALAAKLRSDPAARAVVRMWPHLTTRDLGAHARAWDPVLDPLPDQGSLDDYLSGLLRLDPGEDAPQKAARSVFRDLIGLGHPLEGSLSLAKLVAARLKPDESHVDRHHLEFALGIAKGDSELAAELVLALITDQHLPADGLRRLLAWCDRMEALATLRVEVVAKNHKRLARWACTMAALDPTHLGAPSPATPRRASWIRHYPAPLRPALKRLLRLPDAEERAHRLLRRAIPDREALARELNAVRTRLRQSPDSSLRARESSLLSRMEVPRPLRATDVKKLTEKVDRAAHQADLERIDQVLDQALLQRIGLDAPLGENSSWWEKPETRQMVAGIAALPAPEQRLGMALIARRFGPPPWLPWDAPRNQQFLELMGKRGVDVGPWLASDPVQIERGRILVRLQLEDDPLEILLMGERFSTCLSLDGVNFFSAVMNAVDVNKRVLYGRNSQGGVVGRCLLALTNEGQLLTFQPYAHDTKLNWEDLVASFVRDLAERMHTSVATRGDASPLLGSRWYNDGPRDVTRALSAFAKGSALRNALTTVEPGEAIPLLEAAVGPLEDREELLFRVFSLPEVVERPHLVLLLAPRLLASKRLAWRDRVSAAKTIASAGSPDLARAVLLVSGFTRWALERCRECPGGCYPNLNQSLHLLVKIAPADALHVIRKARRTARDRRYERRENLVCEVAALKRLGREGQAETAIRRGVARGIKGLRESAEAELLGQRTPEDD